MINQTQTIAQLTYQSDFHDLLEQLMEAQQVSTRQLCEGICSETMLSKVKQGKRILSKMMRDRLMERLGVSGERNEHLLFHEEYVKWKERCDIIKSVERREISRAKELLAEYTKSEDFAEKVGQQFYYAMEIQLMFYEAAEGDAQENQAGELADKLELAVKLTVPDIDSKKICELQLSAQELNLILEYEKYRHPERLVERCDELLQYIESSPMDIRSRAKIYPKVALYQCEMLSREEIDYQKIFYSADRAIEYLRSAQKSHYLWELLTLREELLEKWSRQLSEEGKDEQAAALEETKKENREWKNAIEAVCRLAKLSPETTNDCYLYLQQEVYCTNEVMRRRRKMLRLSRKKLCHDELLEKTLYRMEIENRKTQKHHLDMLFERLHLSSEPQHIDIVANNREALELLEKLVKYSNNFDLENERKTLEKLKQCINLDIPLNRQFVKQSEAILLYGEDKNNREKAFELMKEALEYTVSLDAIQGSERLYLTGGEISCLDNMASYVRKSDMNLYHEILLRVCREFEVEDTIEEHLDLYAWIMTSIARVYSNIGKYEQAIALSKKLIEVSIRWGKLALITQNLNCLSWNTVELSEKISQAEKGYSRGTDLEQCVVLSRFCMNPYREKYYLHKLEEFTAGD